MRSPVAWIFLRNFSFLLSYELGMSSLDFKLLSANVGTDHGRGQAEAARRAIQACIEGEKPNLIFLQECTWRDTEGAGCPLLQY
jgi:hypothetical protein